LLALILLEAFYCKQKLDYLGKGKSIVSQDVTEKDGSSRYQSTHIQADCWTCV